MLKHGTMLRGVIAEGFISAESLRLFVPRANPKPIAAACVWAEGGGRALRVDGWLASHACGHVGLLYTSHGGWGVVEGVACREPGRLSRMPAAPAHARMRTRTRSASHCTPPLCTVHCALPPPD